MPSIAAQPHVHTVWIDNPPLNVLGVEVADQVAADLRKLPDDTRVVVLRGRGGRAFSAGANIKQFMREEGPPAHLYPLVDLIETLPQPAVAAIEGYCLGGGLEVALACDVRVASRDAQLGFPEAGLGLIPGGGGTQRAPRLIGPGRASWLIFSGERLDAETAHRWGLVEFLADDLDEELARLTGMLARQSPHALAEAKRLLRETRERGDDRREHEAFLRCIDSDQGREGVAAFSERRDPIWKG